MAQGPSGWVSYTPASLSELPDEERQQVEQRMREREEGGPLQAIVEVRVYEHAEEPQVTFPPGAALGPGTDPAAVARVVARASGALARWR